MKPLKLPGVHIRLQRARITPEQVVLRRYLVIDADVVLVSVERLAGDKEIVRRLGAGRADVRLRQQFKVATAPGFRSEAGSGCSRTASR